MCVQPQPVRIHEHQFSYRLRRKCSHLGGDHPSERVIIYKSDKEGGRIQYPGRSDVPIPERLKKRGYERVELNVRDLSRFEKHHNVANERRHFDRNGRGF